MTPDQVALADQARTVYLAEQTKAFRGCLINGVGDRRY
jgi:hypothetical protein